jgi:predicted dehydrogenase
MDNAHPYQGQRLSVRRAVNGIETENEFGISPKNHFALEMDHMADCVLNNRDSRTPGAEGLRDLQIMEAIYKSAETRTPVKIDKW